MANILYDSFLNPVKFHKLDPSQLPNYTSRFQDDWAFRRTIQPWDQKVCFYQPWLENDSIKLQYVSNFNPISFQLKNDKDQLMISQDCITLQQDELRPAFYIRQVEIDLTPFPAGLYYLQRTAAGVVTVSDPFEIREAPDSGELFLEDPDPTLCIEFSHYEPYQGIKFQSPFSPAIRVPGILKPKAPGSKDTIYEDQLLNQTMITSIPYRVFDFILGGYKGVPPWFADKINRIFGCSTLSIDGRLYTKSDNASFELTELDGYPMGGYSIELREKLNQDSIATENDTVIEGIAAAALIIDNAGFGIQDQTGYTEIISLQ
jgi:hypothetical protein